MEQYVNLIYRTLVEGVDKGDRTGTGTKSIFGHQCVYDMKEGFPLLNLKKTHFKSIIYENLWFLQGGTNTEYLNENGVTIWDEWANERGELGPIYGKQWVDWGGFEIVSGKVIEGHNEGINQIQQAIEQLKNNPDDRGIIVSAWNVGELQKMALRPCHAFFQFYSVEIPPMERYQMFNEWVAENNVDITGMSYEDAAEHYSFPKRYVSLQLYQRSADIFLGVPFNVAGYSLLLHMVAKVVNMVPDKFVHTFGDAHIYSNHKDQVNQLLHRTVDIPTDLSFAEQEKQNIENGEIPDYYNNISLYDKNLDEYGGFFSLELPTLKLADKDDIFDFTFEDIELNDYVDLGAIKAPVAV